MPGHPSIGVEAPQTAAPSDLVGVAVALAGVPTDPVAVALELVGVPTEPVEAEAVEAEDGAGRTTGRSTIWKAFL